MKVGMIAAVDLVGMIGYDNKIPWPFNKVDMKRFKDLTMGSTVVMGRKTYDSLPFKSLPGRIIHVVSYGNQPADLPSDVKWFNKPEQWKILPSAIKAATTDLVWIAGGAQIYDEVLFECMVDEIDLTIHDFEWMPDSQENYNGNLDTRLPKIPYHYQVDWEEKNPNDSTLIHRHYSLRDSKYSYKWNDE